METAIVFLVRQPGSEWLPALNLYRMVAPDKGKGIHLWGPAPLESCRTFARLHAAAATDEGAARYLNAWAAESGGFDAWCRGIPDSLSA